MFHVYRSLVCNLIEDERSHLNKQACAEDEVDDVTSLLHNSVRITPQSARAVQRRTQSLFSTGLERAYFAFGSLSVCADPFDQCWNDIRQEWKTLNFCVATMHKCRRSLCTRHLERHCEGGTSRCHKIMRMCQIHQQVHEAARLAASPYQASQAKVKFLHIPRNAGSSIEEAGASMGIMWGLFDKDLGGKVMMPDGSICHMYHVPPSFISHRFTDSDVFCAKRHPYERAVSEYKYLLSVPWGRGYGKHYHDNLYAHAPCSAAGLNLFLQTTIRHVHQGNTYAFDCHFVPQSDYIWEASGKQVCKHILDVDALPGAFDALMARSGHKVELGTLRENSHADNCPQLSASDLTADTKLMIEAAYARDFSNLGFRRSFDLNASSLNVTRLYHFSNTVTHAVSWAARILLMVLMHTLTET